MAINLPTTVNSLPTIATQITSEFNRLKALLPTGNVDNDAYITRTMLQLVNLWQQPGESNATYAFRVVVDAQGLIGAYASTFFPALTSAVSTDTGTTMGGPAGAAGTVASGGAARPSRGTTTPAANAFPTNGSGNSGAVLQGDYWIVTGLTAAGVAMGANTVFNGDVLIAQVSSPGQTATNWDILKNELGFVVTPIANGGTGAATAAAGLAALGGLPLPVSQTVTANTTLTRWNQGVFVNATAAPVTITLAPSAGANGQEVIIYKIDSSANAVTLAANGAETLAGAATISSQNGSLSVLSDGTNPHSDDVLPFIPENPANKGAANGYAPLNASSQVPAANLPIDATATDITMNGAQAAGATGKVADAGHVHPTDTSRAPLASPTFTGVPAAPTAATSTSTTQLATTAYVVGQAATVAPIIDGTAAVGVSTLFARQDHVHPTDTTRATDSLVVHLAGTETITGAKTFSTAPVLNTALGVASGGTGAITAAAALTNLTAMPQMNVATITANTTVTNQVQTTLANSNSAVTITLPAPNTLLFQRIKQINSMGNSVTITPPSGTIDGAATKVISAQYSSVDIGSDGTNYFLL